MSPVGKSGSLGSLVLAALLVPASVLPLLTGYPVLAVLPGLAILSLLLMGRRPELGLYAIIFLIPFGNFRELGGPLGSIKIHWVLALVLLGVVAMRVLVDRAFLDRFRSNLWPFFIGFLGLSLLSTLFSKYMANAAEEVKLIIVAIVFFGLIISLVPKDGVTSHIPGIVAISVSLSAAFAVVGNLTGVDLFSEGDHFSRSTGGTADPNALAMQIIFGLPFLVFWLTRAGSLGLRFLAAALIAINLAAMIGTFSRSGALVLGASLLALVIINLRGIRPRHLGLLLLAGSIVVITAGVMIPKSFWDRQATLVSSEQDRSLSRRASYLIVAREAILERPLIGHGPGTFRDLFALTDWAELYQREGQSKRRYAHNTYLEVLVGTGLLGAFFYFALLAVSLRNYVWARRRLVAVGDFYHADQVAHYLVAFGFLLLYLAFFSDVYQKFLLLCLGLSQIWVRRATDLTSVEEGGAVLAKTEPQAAGACR